MPIKMALSFFACLAALFAPSSGHAGGDECAKRLSGAPAIEMRLVTELQSRSASLISWNVLSGQPMLAALNAEGQLDVFDPAKGGLPVTSVQAARAISRFEWEEPGRGGLLVLSEDGELSRHQAVDQKAAEPVDVMDMVFGDLPAIGTIGLARVRIMPVGSVGPSRNLRTSSGGARWGLVQRADGTPVTAVSSASSLRVYAVRASAPGKLIWETPVAEAVEPHWTSGAPGEPILIYVDGSFLVAQFPLDRRPPLSVPVATGSKLQVAPGREGDLLVMALAEGPGDSKVYELAGHEWRERATVARALRLFPGPGGAHMVAVLDQGSDGKNHVRFAWLDESSSPFYSLPIDSSEEVKNIEPLALKQGRVLLAVATTRTIYVLELKAAPLEEQQVPAP